MSSDVFDVKRLFLECPLCAAGGGAAVDDVSRYTADVDSGSAAVPDGCNPFELIFCFNPGIADDVYETVRSKMLLSGNFCGYGLLPLGDDSKVQGSADAVPAGRYLFVQNVFTGFECVRAAAETVWLESLWNETALVSHEVFVRLIKESAGWVVQVIWAFADQPAGSVL